MVSANDTSILAMLSRYPDMQNEEADRHIERIEHEENVPVCLAVVGRMSPDDLDDDSRQVYNEFKRWSEDRTQRIHSEQLHARRENNETRMSQRMKDLHQRGIISDQVLLLYGISGPLPERQNYQGMSRDERRRVWVERLERRFGRNWDTNFRAHMPEMFREPGFRHVNWLREGF